MAKKRVSKATWDKIKAKIDSGQSIRSIAREFGLADTSIRTHFGLQVKKVKEVANQIVAAEIALSNLPENLQLQACRLADDLRSISKHIGSGSKFGAMTYHRLSGIANQQVDKINEADIEGSIQHLQNVAVITRTANEAARIPIDLLNANKKIIDELNSPSQHEQITKIERVIVRPANRDS